MNDKRIAEIKNVMMLLNLYNTEISKPKFINIKLGIFLQRKKDNIM